MTRRQLAWCLLLVAVPVVWLLIASAVWCYGTRMPFTALAWWDALVYWRANWWCSLWLVAGALLPSLLLLIFIIVLVQWLVGLSRRPLTTQGRSVSPSAPAIIRSNTDNLGHARWATDEENTKRWSGPNPVWGGKVVGELYNPLEEKGPFETYDPSTWGRGGKAAKLIDDGRFGSTHSMIIAGSGGGKSMMTVSNLLTWKGPVVVFDPAGELGPMVKRAREAMGHRVVILDPDYSENCGMNACGWIKPISRMAEIDVKAQVERVCGATPKGEEGAKDNTIFFKNRGKALVTAVLADILWDESLPKHLRTLTTMRALLAAPEADIKKMLRSIHDNSKSRLARQLAASFSGSKAEETFSGVCQSAEEDTSWLSVEAYGDLVSGDALQTSDILKGDTDVFISLPLKSMQDTPRVARVIIGGLLNEIYEAKGNIDTRVLFEIDEAWILGAFDPLDIARPGGRKFGVTLQMLYTSISEIERQWGTKGAKAWFNDVSWYAFSGLNELQTAREISEGIGEYGAVRRSESENRGRSGRGIGAGSRSRGRSVTYSEAARRVLQSSEILRDLRSDALLVLPRSGKAALLGQALYFRRKEFIDLVDDNRFAKGPGGKNAQRRSPTADQRLREVAAEPAAAGSAEGGNPFDQLQLPLAAGGNSGGSAAEAA